MRYLGLDLGTKTLGISLSDNSLLIASTYKTINFNNYEELLNELSKIIDEFNITKIILGLPKNMNNTYGDAAKRSIDFKEILEKNFNIEVILQDERLTTVEAHNIMIKGGLSRKKRKKYVDSLSANIILQNYLDSERKINHEK